MDQIKYDMRIIYAILGGRVSYQLNNRFKHNFEIYDVDMNPDIWMVMMCLWEKDGQTQQELCNTTLKDRPTMSHLIDTMVKMGLVTRKEKDDDLRAKQIWLTSHGKHLEGKARFVGNKTLKEALRGLSQEELNICQETLRIIFNNSKL